ncbi:MAG: hypothetical protein AAF267_06470 [Deinococcota bacterium]
MPNISHRNHQHAFLNLRVLPLVLFVLLGFVFSASHAQTNISLDTGQHRIVHWCPQQLYTLGVITLRPEHGNADFDMYVYTDAARTDLIGTAALSGNRPEIVFVGPFTRSTCLHILVRNYAGGHSNYHFTTHTVDFWDKLFARALRTRYDCANLGCSNPSDALVEGIGDSILHASLEAATVITDRRHISPHVQHHLLHDVGSGFWGSFASTYASEFVRDAFRFY